MNNLKISTRMAGTFGALVVLLLAVIAAALTQLASIYGSTADIAENWLPSVELVNRLDAQLSEARLNEFRHLTTQDPAAKAEVEKAMGDIRASIKQTETSYQALISSDEERKLYQTYTEARTKYGEMAGKLLELSRKNETEQAFALLQGESRKWFMQSSDTLDKLVVLNSQGAKAASASAAGVYLNARLVMGAAALLAIILAVVAAVWLIRSITRPLAQAVQAADRVAAGDLSGTIVVQSRDETGHL
ncbi:MCP four helix bundle domain-containing protein, partial [Acidovorax sp. Root219]|uniref:MCP four helix bundle domain-containing protein n=1 Tax=Acidovorax sp. Root219 TaxID=1736493 RepID=UPI001F48796F